VAIFVAAKMNLVVLEDSMEKVDEAEGTRANDLDSMKVSASEYDALIHIRGLQEDAHFLVMTAKRHPDGSHTLQGQPKAFDKLAHDLSEEIEFELSPRNKLRQLAKVYNRLLPDDFF
jgi:hypothetical protein